MWHVGSSTKRRQSVSARGDDGERRTRHAVEMALRSRAEPLEDLAACRGRSSLHRQHSQSDGLSLVRRCGVGADYRRAGGAALVDVAPLAARQNVLGSTPSRTRVSRATGRFDVGILPYSIDEFTAGIMPVKLKEYLAAGLPVVATPLPEVMRFAEHHPGLVRFAGDPAGFVDALREALSDNAPEAVARRRVVARQFDWGGQMGRMKELLEQALARKCS